MDVLSIRFAAQKVLTSGENDDVSSANRKILSEHPLGTNEERLERREWM